MKKEKIIIAIFVFLFIGVFLAQNFFVKLKSKVVFCDVGQGDGAFLNLENGTQIVVDGGPDNKMIGCAGKYMPYFDRRIEYIIISHPDKDHFVGAIEVLKRYDVSKVYINGDTSDIPEYQEFLRLAKDKTVTADSESDFFVGAAKIDFLSNPKMAGNDSNEKSLVFKFFTPSSSLPINKGEKGRGISILFTGDLPVKIEKDLIDKKIDFSAKILKIGHHGSDGSSSLEFLKAVNPELAVISAGKDNKYGHPSPLIISRLERLGIKYERTDERGDIVVKLE